MQKQIAYNLIIKQNYILCKVFIIIFYILDPLLFCFICKVAFGGVPFPKNTRKRLVLKNLHSRY